MTDTSAAAGALTTRPAPLRVILDTNVALDLWVFDDPRARPIAQALMQARAQWLATAAMRREWQRVLAYPAIAAWRARRSQSVDDALQAFDRWACTTPTPAGQTALRCRDPDDQMFVDLACATGALLLTKDRALLDLRRRARRLSVGFDARTLDDVLPDALLARDEGGVLA